MPKWRYTLDIEDSWGKAKDNKITSIELAEEIVKKLEELKGRMSSQFCDQAESLIENFKEFIKENDDDDDLFDSLFNELYDWADTDLTPGVWNGSKLCWVKTSF